MSRMNVQEMCIYMDDPSHIEDIYQYVICNSLEAQKLKNKKHKLREKAYMSCPGNYQPILNGYLECYMELERYELRHAYAQGILSAYRMFLKIPYLLGNTPESLLYNEQKMCEQKVYFSLVRQMQCQYDQLEPVLNDGELVIHLDSWYDCAIVLGNIHLRFMFLFGVEYGLYQCKLVEPDFRENMDHIKALYERLHIAI